MKLSKKILISNMFIGLSITVLLLLMLWYTVSSFFRDYSYATMEKDVLRLSEIMASNGNPDFSQERMNLLMKEPDMAGLSTHIFIIMDGEGDVIYHTPYKYPNNVSNSFLEQLARMDSRGTISLQLSDYPVVAYKHDFTLNVNGQDQTFYLVGLIYNFILYKLASQMMIPVVVTIGVLMLLSVLVSIHFGKRITRPVNSLVEMIGRIGKKESVTSSINSGDEFETIGDALVEVSEEIRRKDLEYKMFYEHVSHDLKTPLTVISGYAEGVRTGIFEDDDQALEKINVQCDNLKKQIEDLIYLSQLETRRQTFEFSEQPLESLIGEVLDGLAVLFIREDIDVDFQPSGVTLLEMDRDKIVRALNNIIANAIRFANKSVRVVVCNGEAGTEVIIEDDGPGFPEKVLKDPFTGYYGDSQVSNGIGLMITYRIMESHHGQVEIFNPDTGGAVVKLVF